MTRVRLSPYGVAAAVYLAAWLVLSWPWLTGAYTIPYDAKALFQAQIQFLANALHSGQSPFWTPFVFVGAPQIADPQSLIFSPAILLAYFDAIPSFHQLDLYVLVLLALSGLAIVKLFEDRGWHPTGAVIAAIAISFGASAAWRIQHIGQIQSYAFFCIALWLLDRTLRRASWGWGIAAGLAIGGMLAEPDQVALLGCYILAGLVVGHWLMGEDRLAAVKRSLAPVAAAGVTTILVSGLPLLFAALYLLSSNRPAIDLVDAARGSLHPASLLTTVVGDLFGALDPKVDYWGPFSESWNPHELTLSQNMSQLYLGALPIFLLLTIGLSRGLLWASEIRVFTVASVAMLLYALGTNTPVFAWMYAYVPGVSFFRRPADATFMLGAMLAILGGYLAHRWLTGGLADARRGWLASKLVLVAAIFALAALVASLEHKLALANKPILLAGVWMLASAVAFRWFRLRAMTRPVASMLAATALMTADLALNNGPNTSTAGPVAEYDMLDPRTRNETVRFLKERVRRGTGSEWRDRVELVGLGFAWPNCALVHGFEHTLGYNPLRIGVVSTALGAGDHIAGPDQRGFTRLFPSYRSTMSNMLGLRFIASSIPIEKVDTSLARGGLKFVARTKDAFIYENTDALPRVLFVRRVLPTSFAGLIDEGRWPDFDPRTTVLLDRSDQHLWTTPDDPTAIGNGQGPGRAVITRYENTVVEVDVEAPVSGFLVLNDIWHPWWKATLDGYPATILKANVMFRAVNVPAGKHRLRFEFHPFSGALAEFRGKAFHGR